MLPALVLAGSSLHEQREQGPLLRCDLHLRHRVARGLLAEACSQTAAQNDDLHEENLPKKTASQSEEPIIIEGFPIRKPGVWRPG